MNVKLIVGLGNPGAKYRHTRHNAGFMIVDEIAKARAAQWQTASKQHCEIALAEYMSQRLILAKPQTFMNESGGAVSALAGFYKVAPADIWVISDDLEVAFGSLRVRYGGSSGGHNGLHSVMQVIGPDFWRYRFGISANDRSQQPSESYVLDNFTAVEGLKLPESLAAAGQVILSDIEHDRPEVTTHSLINQ